MEFHFAPELSHRDFEEFVRNNGKTMDDLNFKLKHTDFWIG